MKCKMQSVCTLLAALVCVSVAWAQQPIVYPAKG
jgi:hypothetical protein